MGILEGKVAVITGAGHGLGRAHALEFAREGARGIVVNDLGVGLTGAEPTPETAEETVRMVEEAGGEAVAVFGDCADWETAKRLTDTAVERWGRLDVLVNNAGILRDRMLFNMTEQDWDDVIRVHLKGHAACSRHACVWWRERAKAGEAVSGRIINTTSISGIFGNAGQTNYGAAKAGIIGFSLALAQEMARYNVTVNVIAPGAETNPEVAITGMPDEARKLITAEQVSPLVAYLASDRAAHVTGRVFNVVGGRIDRFDGWRLVEGVFKAGVPWEASELADVFDEKVLGEPLTPWQVTVLQMMQPIISSAQARRT